MATIAEALALGWKYHQSGQLQQAEQVYRQVLQADNVNGQAWFLLGTVCQAQGKLGEAVMCLRQVVLLRPDHADAHHHLGIALALQGDLDAAVASLHESLRLKPDLAEFHNNLGNVLRRKGALSEAVASLQHALRLKPHSAETHHNLALAFAALGRRDEAIASSRQAVQLSPDHAEAHHNLAALLLTQEGNEVEALASMQQCVRLQPRNAAAHNDLGLALAKLKKWDEARASYQEALRLKPDLTDGYRNLGDAFREIRRFGEAVACYQQALLLRPDFAEVHASLGIALGELGESNAALASLRQAVRLEPDCADAHNNLGNELLARGQFDDALACYREALRLKPEAAHLHYNLGVLLLEKGEVNWAIASLEKAVGLEPNNAEHHFILSIALLTAGNFVRGWPEFEWRFLLPRLGLKRDFRQPLWDGSELGQRTLLLHAEGGFGDAFHFVRYVPLLAERGGRIILECQPEVRSLLQRVPGPAQVVARGEPLPHFDVQITLPSLALIFGTTLETIPAALPYLTPDPERVAFWRRRLAPDSNSLKVGLVWAGRPRKMRRNNPTTTLERFQPLAGVRDVSFYSLQKWAAASQARRPPAGLNLIDWTNELKDFDDTAALIANLDLVITVDTSIVHLAGALGKPVWTMLAFCPDFRWLLDRDDTPWYPTMRLFRQKEPENWDEVFQRIATELKRMQSK